MSQTQKTVDALFDAVLDLPREQRAAYLEKVCAGDVPLRQRVEALLCAHEGAGAFMDSPAQMPLPQAGHVAPTDQSGEKIGPYRLLQQIGEGGCGVVYMAEQEEPVRRRLALKVIKLGMDTKSVIARFEAERQALALMDHPNIARVFDVGATDAGRPYFVMELVKGIPIHRYCDERSLNTGQRLRLFIQVCQAIQHAHQKGIIHRDIKPSNILVADYDGVAVPKIIDFGIAKATSDQRLTEKTLFTAFEQFIGTPAYMSPEQAQLTGLDVDTRSDIYSLGVLLYELLTGKTPFESERLVAAGVDGIRRIIREEEPVRPSTRLHTMNAAEQTTVAQHRQTEPPKLVHLIRGDLDWIVMKCLEKDRARRYETANGLAFDLKRHLNNEPVLARPPSGAYRVRKFVRRNKVLVTASVIVAAVLVLGFFASTWQAIRATRAERTQTRLKEAAQTAQDGERLQARMAREQLLRLSVANGVRLENAGDLTGALLWFSQSLRLVEGDPDQERVHRLRYASVLQHCPKLIQVLSQTSAVGYAVFSPNGSSVLTTGGDARVWDATTGEPITPALGLAHAALSTAFNYDGTRVAVFGADHNTARVYDARTGDPISPPLVNSNRLYHAAFSPDGRRVVTGGWDSRVLVWDADSGTCVLPPLRHQMVVTQASFSPDNRRILTASFDGTARLWDAATGQELCPPLQHEASVRDAVFSPDGRYVATASVDRTARLWDANTGKPVGQPLNHPKEVYHVSFSPDGRRLLTSGLDEARVWNLSTGEFLPFKHVSTDGWMRFPLFSPNGNFVISADSDHSARVYDALTVQPLSPPLPHNGLISHAAFSPDSRHVVTASKDGTARIWEIPPDTRPTASPSGSLVNRIAFSPDHRRFAMASGDGTARLVDALSGNPIGPVLRHDGPVLHFCFSPDGRWLATTGLDATLRVWDAATGLPVGSPMKQADGITFACFSPDSRRVCAAAGGRLRIWEPATGRATTVSTEHSGMIEYAVFSANGQRLVSACSDGTARVWNAETGEAITPVFRHEQAVFHASFSPDARFVVTASSDRTARVWDAKTGELVMVPLSHDTAVQAAAFNSAGTHILTLTAEGVYSWDLPSEDRPIEDLTLQAAVLAGRRIDSTGSFSELTPEESRAAWQRLRSTHAARLYPQERMGPVEAGPWSDEAGRFLGALELTRRTSEREGEARFSCIDLSAAVNLPLSAELPNMARGGSLPTLPQGRQKFGDTEFEIGPGVVQFACGYFHLMGREFPKQFPGLKVGRKCRTLHFLHARRYCNGEEFLASYLIHFANGLTWEIPVTTQNQGDVTYSGDEPGGLKGSIVAWTGTNSLGRVRLFQTSWENPLPEVEVENIDLVSTMNFAPAFLVAITVE